MVRVLVLCEHASLNGGERSLLAVLDPLRRLGFDPCVAVPPEGPLATSLDAMAIRRVQLECGVGQSGGRAPEQRRQTLRKLLIQEAPHLVHANNLTMSRLSGPVLTELGLPGVGHLRDIMRLSAAAVGDLNHHTRLLAVSHAARQWYTAAGLEHERTHVLYNGVDLTKFRPQPRTGRLAEELGLSRDAPLIVSIGQLGMRKGLDVLLEAAQQVVRGRPEVHFVVIGARYSAKAEAVEFLARLRRAAEKSPLEGHVHWLGLRDDVDRLLAEATLLAHAARQEPLGRVLLEAAAAGTPVVATSVGGTAEIFPPDTESARLVPPENPAEMARAILDLLDDKPLRCRMSSDARRIAETRFDARSSARKLAEHYRMALGQ